MNSDLEHMPQLGWRDMPIEDRDEAEMDEREARADARRAAQERTWRDDVRQASSHD